MLVAVSVAALTLSALALYLSCYTFWAVRGTIENAALIVRTGPLAQAMAQQAPKDQPAYVRVTNPPGDTL